MERETLLKALKDLKLPNMGYVIFGGASLAVRNLRATDDIDIFVTQELFQELQDRGWKVQTEPWTHPWLKTEVKGIEIEVYQHFYTEGWQPRFESYLLEPEMVEGYRFMPLSELYEWKKAVRRPKDIADMKLIDAYHNRIISKEEVEDKKHPIIL